MKNNSNWFNYIFSSPIFITTIILSGIYLILRIWNIVFANYNSNNWSGLAILSLVELVIIILSLLLLVYMFSSFLNSSYEHNEKLKSYLERVFAEAERLMNKIYRPFSLPTLRDNYLTKLSIFLYYVDMDRINDLYRSEFGRDEQISEVEESENKKDVGIVASTGNFLSGNLALSKQSKSKKESTVFSKSLEEKVLDWQSAFLRKGNITVGLEYKLTQIAQNFEIDNQDDRDNTDPERNTITVRDEENRLRSIKGYVLIKAPFIINVDSNNIGEYELIYRHPLSELSQNSEEQFIIRISLLKDQLSSQTNLYFQKFINSPIDFHVLGTIVTVKNSEFGKSNFIEVLPLAIYT
jgi:hypothetical protein